MPDRFSFADISGRLEMSFLNLILNKTKRIHDTPEKPKMYCSDPDNNVGMKP